MEAEDTVVKTSEVMEIIESNSGSLPTTKAILDYLSPKLDAIVNTERKAGIKEVVDWLKQENDKNPTVLDGSFIIAKINSARWQAKFKEWGIK